VKRSESAAFAALLFSVAIVVPAAAEQATLAPPPPAVSDEFCSGCFAYLEFPPPPQAEATSILASADTLPPATAVQKTPTGVPAPSVVASARP
jgi:hypothetical protein